MLVASKESATSLVPRAQHTLIKSTVDGNLSTPLAGPSLTASALSVQPSVIPNYALSSLAHYSVPHRSIGHLHGGQGSTQDVYSSNCSSQTPETSSTSTGPKVQHLTPTAVLIIYQDRDVTTILNEHFQRSLEAGAKSNWAGFGYQNKKLPVSFFYQKPTQSHHLNVPYLSLGPHRSLYQQPEISPPPYHAAAYASASGDSAGLIAAGYQQQFQNFLRPSQQSAGFWSPQNYQSNNQAQAAVNDLYAYHQFSANSHNKLMNPGTRPYGSFFPLPHPQAIGHSPISRLQPSMTTSLRPEWPTPYSVAAASDQLALGLVEPPKDLYWF